LDRFILVHVCIVETKTRCFSLILAGRSQQYFCCCIKVLDSISCSDQRSEKALQYGFRTPQRSDGDFTLLGKYLMAIDGVVSVY
jgi:hypothetical protein